MKIYTNKVEGSFDIPICDSSVSHVRSFMNDCFTLSKTPNSKNYEIYV